MSTIYNQSPDPAYRFQPHQFINWHDVLLVAIRDDKDDADAEALIAELTDNY